MSTIVEPVNNQPSPLLRLAFRPLFISGSFFSFLAIIIWLLVLQQQLSFSPYSGLVLWHGHEMLFGFVSAIVIGFLLTAVQNWTGIAGLNGIALLVLTCCWLLARLLLLVDSVALLAAIVDMLFLPLGAIYLARPIIATRKHRNLIFIPILMLMTLANGVFHYGVVNNALDLSQQSLHFMVWLVVLLMTVLGGRVIPFFTANGTQTEKNQPLPLLEVAVIAGTIAIIIVHGVGLCVLLSNTANSFLLFLLGLLHSWRFFRWRFWVCARIPLLWSLHAAFSFIPLGLLLLACSYQFPSLTYSTALHAMLVGAMGTMIISMMARVSLGHTGRALQVHRLMSLAFLAVIASALVRTLGVWLMPQQSNALFLLAGIAWVIGYGIFVVVYWPILSRPRLDGGRG